LLIGHVAVEQVVQGYAVIRLGKLAGVEGPQINSAARTERPIVKAMMDGWL